MRNATKLAFAALLAAPLMGVGIHGASANMAAASHGFGAAQTADAGFHGGIQLVAQGGRGGGGGAGAGRGGFGGAGRGGFRGGFRGGYRGGFRGGYRRGFGGAYFYGPGFYDPFYPFYYPYYYGYPYAYDYAPVEEAPPPDYLPPEDEGAPAPQDWYYCDNPQGYYPYVRQCQSEWQAVPASPDGGAPPNNKRRAPPPANRGAPPANIGPNGPARGERGDLGPGNGDAG